MVRFATVRRVRAGVLIAVAIALSTPAAARAVGELAQKPGAAGCVSEDGAATMLTRRHRPAGRNSVAFSGRIRSKALARGTYRATITATDAAGNRSAPRTAIFTIVKR
jgi:hypothetical protein